MPSLLEALEQKYGESSTESEGSEEEGISVSIYVPRKSPRLTVPSLLVLNDCDIATAGEHQALVDKCAAVEELDLAKNKLNYWPEVNINIRNASTQFQANECNFAVEIFIR